MSLPTQDIAFWNKRIEENGGIEGGMAMNFYWSVIDPIHDKYIKEHIKPSDRVLDAGCGYGRRAGFFKNKKYVGVDLVPAFIEEAKRRYPKKQFFVVDLAQLPFANMEFDWALLISVKRVIQSDSEEKWQQVLKELRRVAKRLLLLEYGNSIPEEIHNHVEIL